MKILVIVSSLRKMYTYDAAKKFETAHKSYGADCTYEYVFVKDMDIQQCNGCFLCISKGETHCPLKDDLNQLIEKIESADCIVFACPNYSMNVNWLTKNLIDRLSYNLHRPKFFNKRFVLLLTSGNFMGTKQALKALSVLTSGGKTIGKLLLYTAPELSEKQRVKQEAKFLRKSLSIFKELDKEYVHKPPLANLMWFASFKANHVKYKETLPADYVYYKDRNYFTDIELSFVQKFIVKQSVKLMRIIMG